MTEPSLFIMQLPSSLWNSPIYEAYDYYVDDGLDTLQGDIRDMFHLRDVNKLADYLMTLRLAMISSHHNKNFLEHLSGFNRLLNACAYTENPCESLFWLSKLTSRVDLFKRPYLKSGLELRMFIPDTGAILGPLSITPSCTEGSRTHLSRSIHY